MRPEDYAYLHELEEDFWWFAGMREISAALLDPFCPPTKDRLVLDAGCGTGGTLTWLTRYGGSGTIVGVEVESMALEFCRQRGLTTVAEASLLNLPFADSTFDLVTSFDVLGHVTGPDDLAMREMQRVLRPAGIALVRVAAYKWMKSSHDLALGTHHRYSLDELGRKLSDAGFDILRATYANSILFPLAALRRKALKPMGLSDRGSDVKPLPSYMQWLNRMLKSALLFEAHLLERQRARLPFGLSAICVAKKPG